MSKNIDNNHISFEDYCGGEKNKKKAIISQSNEKEQEKSEKIDPNLNPKISLNINSRKNYYLLEGDSIGQNYNTSYHINQISNQIKKKRLIFHIRKIRKRKKHDANSKDNIMQAIIRNFIDFFLAFINLIIKLKIKKEKKRIEKEKNKDINLEEIQFKIDFIIKRKIKVKDIQNLSIENFLILDEERKSQQNINSNINKSNINNNKKRLIIIRDFFDSSLDKFFDNPVISLFKEIYVKKKEIINLKKYGIQGIVLKLPKNIKTFKKLKENQINRQKVQIMNRLIKTEFINPKKRKMRKIFKTKKKE